MNCCKPTNAPSLSCTLLTRIMNRGASRNTTRIAQISSNRPCARRSCQCAAGLTRAPVANASESAVAAVMIALRGRFASCQQPHALCGQPHVQRGTFAQAHFVDTVARDVDEQRLLFRAGESHGDMAERTEKFDFGDLGVSRIGLT